MMVNEAWLYVLMILLCHNTSEVCTATSMKIFVFICFSCIKIAPQDYSLCFFFRYPTNFFIPECIKRTFDREGQCGLGNVLGRSLLSGCQESWNNKGQRVHSKRKTKHTPETVRFIERKGVICYCIRLILATVIVIRVT